MSEVLLVSVLCNSIIGLVNGAQAQVVTDHIQAILHAKSIEVDLEYYENSHYYDTLHRAQQEAHFRPMHIVNGLLQVGQSGISMLGIAALLCSLHWGVVAILIAATIPGVLVRLRYANKMYSWQRQRTPAERQAWYFNWILTRDTHAKEVRLFDLGALFIHRFRDVRQQLREEKLKILTRRSMAELMTAASATVAMFGVFAFLSYRALQGIFTLGDVIMYYQAAQRGQGFLGEMLGGLSNLYEDNLFLSYLYEFLDIKRKVVEPVSPKPVPRPMRTGIVFDHVSFQYPASTSEAP